MNLEPYLNAIQTLRAQMDHWGITTQFLIFAAVVALTIFLFSLREILSWYFKVNDLRGEVRQLSNKVQMLNESIEELHDRLSGTAPQPLTPSQSEPPTHFRLDH